MRRAATYAKAQVTYIARREGELTVRDNEKLIVLNQEGLALGYVFCRRVRDGACGLLPRDVVIVASRQLSISSIWERIQRLAGPPLEVRSTAPSVPALAPAPVLRFDPPTSMGLALNDAAWPTPAAVYRPSCAQPPRTAIPEAPPVLETPPPKREPMPPPPEAEANGLLLLALDAGVLLSDALYQELVRMAGAKANDNKVAELLLSWREYDALCKIVEAESLTERVTSESALGTRTQFYSEPPVPAYCAPLPPDDPKAGAHPARVASPSGRDDVISLPSTVASAPPPPVSPSARQVHPSTLLPNCSEFWGPLLDAETGAELHIPIDLRAPLQFTQEDLEAHGPWRGIQADSRDTCLLDCVVYALFAFSTALDCHVTRARTTPIMEACFDHLWCRTVGPLRARNYVGRDALAGLRSALRPWLSLVPPNSADFTDTFLRAVLGDVFKARPLCVLAAAKGEWIDSFLLRLAVDPRCPELIDCTKSLSVEKLLAASLHSQQVRIHTVPDVLILQMPRNGNERLFDRIYPIAELDLSPYMVVAPNNAVRMHLSAVVCVSVGRFVAFVRSPRDEWFAFDPLADRTADGANVPCVSSLPGLAALLSPEGFSQFVSGAFPSDRTPEGRLLRDPYLCVYVHVQ